MKNLLSWLSIIFFFLAAALTFAGAQSSLPVLTFAGFLSLGLAALASGIQVIITKEAFFLPGGSQSLRRRAERYSGLSAQLWGVFFVLFGLICILMALIGIFVPGQVEGFFDKALETPLGWGILSLILGIGLSLYGLARLLAGSADGRSDLLSRLRDLGYRLFGGLCLLIGLVLSGLGLLLIAAPRILSSWLAGLIPAFP